jgi:hypothetical protein
MQSGNHAHLIEGVLTSRGKMLSVKQYDAKNSRFEPQQLGRPRS